MVGVVDNLLESEDPGVRLKTRLEVLSEDSRSAKIVKLREEVESSQRVKLLLSERREDGRIPWHPYAKWDGAHWVLAALADLEYPQNVRSLIPLREQVYKWLLSNEHQEYTEARPYRHRPLATLIGLIKDRPVFMDQWRGMLFGTCTSWGFSTRRQTSLF